jgi:hypothetical protein
MITIARLGLFALITGVALCLLPVGQRTYAQELPPRPVPTTAPAPEEPETPRERSTPVPLGRITGTVIDMTTGAPAPGVTVYVGGEPISSDASGNYLRDGLPAGRYTIWVPAGPGLPRPAQPLLLVELGPGETVTQHLQIRP